MAADASLPDKTDRLAFDGVLVLGAGLAGLSAALAASPRRALVISAEPLGEGCSSAWAQGGVAVAMGADDSVALHAQDTVAAGAGLVQPDRAALLTGEGPDAVAALIALGAPFDTDADGRLVQSLEAAHSRARVARVKGDQAGRAIMQAVIAAVDAAPTLTVWSGARARRLVQDRDGRVRGALIERQGRLIEVTASAVVLATGGVGGLFSETTTPAAVRGEGLGLAAQAGAVITDAEFVQFHPTAMDFGVDPAPLATEALRGEGASLVDAAGRPFMREHDPRGELAPRDIVARAIHRQRLTGGGAFLDCRTAVGDHFPDEFPGVFAACMAHGLDPRVSPIPVAPAAHYHMGGVETDADGATQLQGLFAAGECASTGVHGANRLASNSLLEAAVFGRRAGRAAAAFADPGTAPVACGPAPDLPDAALAELRRALSREAGVERDAEGLGRALALIEALAKAHGEAPTLTAARLIVSGALARRESRGAHFRSDFPHLAARPQQTRTRTAPASPVEA